MVFRDESREDGTRRTVRTEVTVQEQQRTVLFSNAPGTSPETCPLCGNPLFTGIYPLAEEQSHALAVGHSEAGGTCPGPNTADETKGPQQHGDSRRLR